MKTVICFTNLNLFNEEWPKNLPSIPRVGDLIQSKTKHKNNFQLTLEVHNITWKYYENCNRENIYYSKHGWIPVIELHIRKTQQNIPLRGWYEWYASFVGQSISAFI